MARRPEIRARFGVDGIEAARREIRGFGDGASAELDRLEDAARDAERALREIGREGTDVDAAAREATAAMARFRAAAADADRALRTVGSGGTEAEGAARRAADAVREIADAADEADEALDGVGGRAGGVRRWARSARSALDGFRDRLRSVDRDLDDVGGRSSVSGMTRWRMRAEAEVDRVKRALSGLGGAGVVGAGIGGIVSGVSGAGVVAGVETGRRDLLETARQADDLGVSRSDLAVLFERSRREGVDPEAAYEALLEFRKMAVEARAGMGKLNDLFEDVDPSLRKYVIDDAPDDLAGFTRMLEVIGALESRSDQIFFNDEAFAQDRFLRVGRQSPEEVARIAREVAERARPLSDADVDTLERSADVQADLSLATSGVAKEIVLALVGVLDEVKVRLTAYLTDNRGAIADGAAAFARDATALVQGRDAESFAWLNTARDGVVALGSASAAAATALRDVAAFVAPTARAIGGGGRRIWDVGFGEERQETARAVGFRFGLVQSAIRNDGLSEDGLITRLVGALRADNPYVEDPLERAARDIARPRDGVDRASGAVAATEALTDTLEAAAARVDAALSDPPEVSVPERVDVALARAEPAAMEVAVEVARTAAERADADADRVSDAVDGAAARLEDAAATVADALTGGVDGEAPREVALDLDALSPEARRSILAERARLAVEGDGKGDGDDALEVDEVALRRAVRLAEEARRDEVERLGDRLEGLRDVGVIGAAPAVDLDAVAGPVREAARTLSHAGEPLVDAIVEGMARVRGLLSDDVREGEDGYAAWTADLSHAAEALDALLVRAGADATVAEGGGVRSGDGAVDRAAERAADRAAREVVKRQEYEHKARLAHEREVVQGVFGAVAGLFGARPDDPTTAPVAPGRAMGSAPRGTDDPRALWADSIRSAIADSRRLVDAQVEAIRARAADPARTPVVFEFPEFGTVRGVMEPEGVRTVGDAVRRYEATHPSALRTPSYRRAPRTAQLGNGTGVRG